MMDNKRAENVVTLQPETKTNIDNIYKILKQKI